MTVRWRERPAEQLASLEAVYVGLEEEIADNPGFTDVIGIPMPVLAEFAETSLSQFLDTNAASPAELDVWKVIYCMGFVMGTKYGQKHG